MFCCRMPFTSEKTTNLKSTISRYSVLVCDWIAVPPSNHRKLITGVSHDRKGYNYSDVVDGYTRICNLYFTSTLFLFWCTIFRNAKNSNFKDVDTL